ncbi:unnamed protein product [Calypogeia fissa]
MIKRVDIFGSKGSLKRVAEADRDSCTHSLQKYRVERSRRRDDACEVSSTQRGSKTVGDGEDDIVDLSATRLYSEDCNREVSRDDGSNNNIGFQDKGGPRSKNANGRVLENGNQRENVTLAPDSQPRVHRDIGTNRGGFRSENAREWGLHNGNSQPENMTPTPDLQTVSPRDRGADRGLQGQNARGRGMENESSGQRESLSPANDSQARPRDSTRVPQVSPLDAPTRLHYADLVKENREVKQQLKLLVETANITLKSQKQEVPDFCRWECVKRN